MGMVMVVTVCEDGERDEGDGEGREVGEGTGDRNGDAEETLVEVDSVGEGFSIEEEEGKEESGTDGGGGGGTATLSVLVVAMGDHAGGILVADGRFVSCVPSDMGGVGGRGGGWSTPPSWMTRTSTFPRGLHAPLVSSDTVEEGTTSSLASALFSVVCATLGPLPPSISGTTTVSEWTMSSMTREEVEGAGLGLRPIRTCAASWNGVRSSSSPIASAAIGDRTARHFSSESERRCGAAGGIGAASTPQLVLTRGGGAEIAHDDVGIKEEDCDARLGGTSLDNEEEEEGLVT